MNNDIFLDKIISGVKSNIFDPLQIYSLKINERKSIISAYAKKLDNLLKIPIIIQKSQEWYDVRKNMITASDWAQALGEGKFGTQKELIKKKCQPLSSEKDKNNPFFKWGNMFEDIAVKIYGVMQGVNVHNFGLISHPVNKWFGASPDGISNTGIMLEIKCPFRRKLDGTVPRQYYYQIQGQLDVCDLMECDYFECEFKKYENEEDFYNNFNDNKIKGIIIELRNPIKGQKYLYSSLKLPENNFENTEKYKMFVKCNQENIYKINYWYLNKWNLKRVYRDQNFIDINMKKLYEIWLKICDYKIDNNKFQIEILKKINLDTETYMSSNNEISNNYVFKDELIEDIYIL